MNAVKNKFVVHRRDILKLQAVNVAITTLRQTKAQIFSEVVCSRVERLFLFYCIFINNFARPFKCIFSLNSHFNY